MIPRLFRPIFINALVVGFSALILFNSWQVSPANAGAGNYGILQQATSYPEDIYSTESGYPGEFETPFPATQESLPPMETTEPTPAVNTFATEDAQMRDTLGTEIPSATPAPSLTPANTATALLTATPTGIAATASNAQKNRFRIDWSYFWIGFAVPLLVCCGVILYLLDRHPDFFTPRPKS
jgi:hypothetical protein